MKSGNVERKKGSMGKLEKNCPSCGENSIVRDYQQNIEICENCGLVLKEGIKDRGPEWRSFSQEGREKKSRAGPPSTETIHDRGLSTQIDRKNRDCRGKSLSPRRRSQMYRLRKLHSRSRMSESKSRSLATAFSEMSRISSQLGLPRSVRESGAKTYREVSERDLIRGRSIEGMAAAVLYLECIRANIPRTLKEIAEVSPIDEKKIGRNYRYISDELNVNSQLADSVNYVARFGSELKVSGEIRSKTMEIIRGAKERGLTVGMNPAGIAAASVYIACLEADEGRSQSEVGRVAGVTEVTVRNRYKEIARELGIEEIGEGTRVKETVSKELPEPDEVETKIENVVASVSFIGATFDLKEISSILDGSEYNPDKFPGLIYHIKEPVASFLIFESGKANCVGANSLEGMEGAIKNLTSQLKSGGVKVGSEVKVQVQNLVIQVDFGVGLNLDDIHRSPLVTTSYDPETFPGLSINLEKVDGDFLLFASGSGICHLRRKEDLDKAIRGMLGILCQFVEGD